MEKTLRILRNGLIIDPVNGVEQIGDVWIEAGKIVSPKLESPTHADILDLSGKWVCPGLIDMHVHLRDPGQEYKETIESGTRAAAAGGITAVACMPNTIPVNDCGSVTQYIVEQARGCDARVYPVGAVSAGSKGAELADYAEMKAAGAVAVTDDGLPVVNSQLMRRSLEYAMSHGMFVMSHSEESALSRGGCMNESSVSTRLGLRGIPNAAEAIMVYRDIALAELTGGHMHFSHVSTRQSLDLIRQAKARGISVSAESTPHYFTLTDEAVGEYNTNAKMNPPLRSEEDRQAVIEALQDGTIDAIATDHAPHSVVEKELEFDQAAFGIIGLETSVSLSLELVRKEYITKKRLIELMSCNPAKLLGVTGGDLGIGQVADITVIDPEASFTYSQKSVVSKVHNSPFLDWQLQGRAVVTILGGRIVHNLLD